MDLFYAPRLRGTQMRWNGNMRLTKAMLLLGILFNGGANIAYADSLQDVIGYTLQTNPTMLITESNRKAADEDVNKALADFFPTIDLSGGYGPATSKNSNTIPLPNGPSITLHQTEANLLIRQNLFRGGQTYYQVGANKAKMNSAAYQVNTTEQSTILAVGEAYFNVLRAQAVVTLAKKNLEVLVHTFTMIDHRYQRGLSNRADFEQAKARLELAEVDQINEEANLEDAISLYLQVIGKLPENLTVPPNLKQYMPHSQAQSVALAIENSPVLKGANEDVIAAKDSHLASQSTNYPSINLDIIDTRNHNVSGIKDPDYQKAVMLRANYNLYRGGADLATQRQTADILQATFEQRNQTLRKLIQNTRTAWTRYHADVTQLPHLKIYRDSEKETVILYRMQYQLGNRTLLDLLDAENEFYTSSKSYVNGQFSELLDQFKLLNSIGILVQTLNEPLAIEAFVDTEYVPLPVDLLPMTA